MTSTMPPFQIVPHAWLKHPELQGTAGRVFEHIAQVVGPVGNARVEAPVGLATLAGWTGYSPRHCSRLLHWLEALGWLEIIRVGKKQVNRYRLTAKALAYLEPIRAFFLALSGPLKCMARQMTRAKAKLRTLLRIPGDRTPSPDPPSKETGGLLSKERRRRKGRDRSWSDTPLGTFATYCQLRQQGFRLPHGAWA